MKNITIIYCNQLEIIKAFIIGGQALLVLYGHVGWRWVWRLLHFKSKVDCSFQLKVGVYETAIVGDFLSWTRASTRFQPPDDDFRNWFSRCLGKKSFWKRIENPKNYILWPRELTSFFGKIPVSSPAPTDDVFRRWVFAGVTLTMGKALLDDSFLSILKL